MLSQGVQVKVYRFSILTVYWTIRHHDQQPRSAQCGVNIISKLLIKRTATPPSFTEFTLIILFYGTHFLEN